MSVFANMNLSVPKAFGLSMLSSVLSLSYIIHDNNITNASTNLNKTWSKPNNTNDYDYECTKKMAMGWWPPQ